MDYRTKVLAGLILLAIVDAVIPIPIIGLFLMYVIIARPRWFLDLVAQMYGRAAVAFVSGVEQADVRTQTYAIADDHRL